MATARSTLRAALGKKMRTRSISGTCTANTVTTSVCDTGRDEESDYWNKSWITVADTSASTTETREVNDFTTGASSGTGKFDVLQAFSAAPTTGDTYELHQKLSVDELNDSINHAIRRARGKIFTKNSATVASTASTYDYTLGTATGEVYRVELQASTATSTYPYTKMLRWRLRDGASTPILEFDQEIPGGYTIRYYHITQESELAADTATTDLPLDYIYDAARAELYSVLMSDCKDDNEYRRYMSSRDEFKKDAASKLRQYAKQFPAGRVFKEPQHMGGEGWYEVAYSKEDLK